MKNNYFSLLLIVMAYATLPFVGYAQIKKENLKIGFITGTGTQNSFPFNLESYTHEITFYKARVNYTFKEKRKWAFEINLEPGFNIAEHQLLNKYFIKPTDSDNFREEREIFLQKRTINEYVLDIGFLVRYSVYKNVSAFAIGGVGPMIGDKETARLAKGFAFSDIFGMGISYEINKIQLDFRYSVRHTSNLEFKKPNNGHNTTNIELGILFQL
ncbi:acyloxyacyl hydrolase [uncultured Algibacter sp.]|uniref:acyloxyacyl hydrolase n=1 Tax=uncultured Algibacter sp. TaxID=298659 RepID=UPI003216E380